MGELPPIEELAQTLEKRLSLSLIHRDAYIKPYSNRRSDIYFFRQIGKKIMFSLNDYPMGEPYCGISFVVQTDAFSPDEENPDKIGYRDFEFGKKLTVKGLRLVGDCGIAPAKNKDLEHIGYIYHYHVYPRDHELPKAHRTFEDIIAIAEVSGIQTGDFNVNDGILLSIGDLIPEELYDKKLLQVDLREANYEQFLEEKSRKKVAYFNKLNNLNKTIKL